MLAYLKSWERTAEYFVQVNYRAVLTAGVFKMLLTWLNIHLRKLSAVTLMPQ